MPKKILVVDDEIELCDLVKRYLEQQGDFKVIIATDPTQAETICVKEKPDLVLLDIVMPEMSGREVIKKLKSNPKTQNIKIVVTSGGGEMVFLSDEQRWSWQPNTDLVDDREGYVPERSHDKAAETYGVDDYLAKPFPPSFLMQVIEDVLSRTEE